MGKSDTPNRCKGIAGLAQSVASIVTHHNVSGVTMVVEDDFKVLDWDRVMASMALVPDNWELIRWDCYGYVPSTYISLV